MYYSWVNSTSSTSSSDDGGDDDDNGEMEKGDFEISEWDLCQFNVKSPFLESKELPWT